MINQSQLLRCVLILALFSVIIPVYTNNVPIKVERYDEEHHDHDHDHDHDHEHEGEAFHLLVESVTGVHGDTLHDHDVEILMSGLESRFHIHDNPHCLDEIFEKAPQQHEYNETTFLETAQRTLHFLTNGNCSVALQTDDLTFDAAPVCRQEVNGELRKLEGHYEVFSTENCFNEFTLLDHNCTDSNDDLVYLMLTHLFEGHCILPSSENLEDELFEHIGVESDTVTEENFEKLLTDLQIGSPSESHDEESHDDHENHDHFRTKRSEEDEHEHDDHDHEHEHEHEDHHGDEAAHTETCYSNYQLRSIYGNFGNLSREQVIEMCPVFLQQILSAACSAVHEHETTTDSAYTTAMKYGYGTASVAIISLLAFVGMFFFPVINTTKFKLTMQFFIALGVGTMSGDAIFHILPDVLGLHSHAPGEHVHEEVEIPDYTWKLVVVVAAIWVLFIFENGLKVFSSHEPHNHSYSTDSSEIYENSDALSATSFKKASVQTISGDIGLTKDEMKDNRVQDYKPFDENAKTTYFWGITATGIMVFLGDILHNFGDGIAIGAAFSYSWPQGVGTSLAIVFHELPHEFGDFAIYMNNGLSKCKALLMNFAAACFCFIGLYVALALSEDPGVRVWLLSFVAGMFLYVSFVNVMREMVDQKSSHPKWQFALQNLGLVVGWAILLLLGIYEEQLINSIA